MTRRLKRTWLFVFGGAALLLVAILGFPTLIRALASAAIGRQASARGMTASWRTLDHHMPWRFDFTGLDVRTASGDTAFRAESLSVAIDPWSVLLFHPRASAARLAHARVRLHGTHTVDPDTLADDPRAKRKRSGRSRRVEQTADRIVRILLAPARELPSLTLRDVTIEPAASEDAVVNGVRLAALDLEAVPGGIRLASRGLLMVERPVSFDVSLEYGHDDRITGRAQLMIPGRGGPPQPLEVGIDGRVAQDPGAGTVRLEQGSTIHVGHLPLSVAGSMSRHGPRVQFALGADGVSQQKIRQSLPPALLGPLVDLSVRGTFDYRLRFDLDVSKPEAVDFEAKVIRHGLALDPAGTRLKLFGLEQPFLATIHLPHNVFATRELSYSNPHFRPLSGIDPYLAHAVVTNEDGGFFRHRGFNIEAVKGAIADDIHAGAYRRGAGTITMQLARNLYLGHERTLSRKAQEVVLAWVLENLTDVSKDRLLEIYLNIIEWGPGVLGADEASYYYFGHDCGRMSVDEALFMCTIVPSPNKWRYRLAQDGSLKSFARSQMHFIGRAMIAKGWLEADQLPPRDDLRIDLRGQAHEVLFPPSSIDAGTGSARMMKHEPARWDTVQI
jgi:hypothetical protein